MALIKTNTGNKIRGCHNPSAKEKEDCYAVIAALDFADFGRGAGTLHKVGSARIDMQGRTGGGDANIQVQIGNGTVAAAMVSNSLLKTGNVDNQRGVKNGVVSVLNQSMDTRNVWEISGQI